MPQPDNPLYFQPKSILDEVQPGHEPEAEDILTGGILLNFRTLELFLRVSLFTGKSIPDYSKLHLGDTTELSTVTDFSSLGELIAQHNARIREINKHYRIDPQIVALRDALAHGRWVQAPETGDWYIVKFSKPRKQDTTVTVTYHQRVTTEWLSEQAGRLINEFQKVAGILQAKAEAARHGERNPEF